VRPSDLLTAGQQKLVDGLEKAARAFNEAARPSPPVVVINQYPPPSSPSPSWHQDPDLPAIGAALSFIALVLLVAGCCWLRQYRPDQWQKVTAGVRRFVTWLALPCSWVLERLAGLLRLLHARAESQQAASSSGSGQVSKTEFFYNI